jgi:excisionase family DNA binding protein
LYSGVVRSSLPIMSNNDSPQWLTREQAARRLGVSLSTIDRLRKTGDLKERPGLGRSVRITVASVDGLDIAPEPELVA